MKQDLCALTATELLAAYRARQLSPVEATRAALARIADLNPVLNCFNVVDEKAALAAARASEARWRSGTPLGLLDGVPTSIKDLLLTKGWPTRRGSKTIDPKGPWKDDAPAVARLKEHGAVLLGKTTTPEFGWKGVTDSPLTGITRNPWDPSKTPGGSSGGGAAAVASGMGPLTVGTDGGYDLESIAAVVLGGTALAGGKGGVAGTVGGVLLLAVLDTLFNQLEVNSFVKDVVRGVVLQCGVFDLPALVRPDRAGGRLVRWGTATTVLAYAGTRDPDSPVLARISPIPHLTPRFPAAWITGGNDDPLTRGHSVVFAERLGALGVPATTLFWPDDHRPKLPHLYPFNLDTAEGQAAFASMVAFLRSRE